MRDLPDFFCWGLVCPDLKEAYVDRDRKKELSMQYRQGKRDAGVYRITNKENGKALVASAMDLNSMNGKKFMLEMGNHYNKLLQAEWRQYGGAAFMFEVLEVLKEKDDGFFDKKGELQKLEDKWVEKLRPFGDKGYNEPDTGK
jgi:hypothetical protein